ncbi:MAG TPA: hypothetical protein VGI47_08240 [Candidatus Binataceae bacterium]|jgi:hypothetical protein
MPRKTSKNVGSAFRQVQQQARTLLVGLRREIQMIAGQLERLKREESQLSALAGIAPAGPRGARGIKRGKRTDWSAVLVQLPRQFQASHIRGLRGLKERRSSEIFAAITRWIDSGGVKRKSRGIYERVD